MDLMNGQASNVNIAATASEVRYLRSLGINFLTWLSKFSSIMFVHILKSEVHLVQKYMCRSTHILTFTLVIHMFAVHHRYT